MNALVTASNVLVLVCCVWTLLRNAPLEGWSGPLLVAAVVANGTVALVRILRHCRKV